MNTSSKTYYAFLKGVNVGGNTKVDMTLLKAALKTRGMDQASSYLNSGNLIVSSSLNPDSIQKIIHETIAELFRIEIHVFIRSHSQLSQAMKRNPLDAEATIDKSKLLVYFLSKSLAAKDFQAFTGNAKITERFQGVDDLLFIHYHNGVSNSVLTTAYIDKQLQVISTGRNMNTIEALINKAC